MVIDETNESLTFCEIVRLYKPKSPITNVVIVFVSVRYKLNALPPKCMALRTPLS